MWGWVSTVKILLQAGADINAITTVGRTPLMYAVEYMHISLSELLAHDKKIHINAADNDGFTAFMICVEKACSFANAGKEDELQEALQLMERLTLAGADPDAETNKKKNSFQMACKAQASAVVLKLMTLNCKRKPESLALLTGEAATIVNAKIKKDELAAKAEEEEAAKKAVESAGFKLGAPGTGYRTRSPYGAWVEYNDKRTNNPFYYNPVTRKSQWAKPPDFRPDKRRAVKSATFGMSFYH